MRLAFAPATGRLVTVYGERRRYLTGLLIVISVALDIVQRIEANLMMRNYGGFLTGADGKKGKRIRGRNY